MLSLRGVDPSLTLGIIEGFHVTSYQANFASDHTRDRYVGFLFTRSCIGKYNKMSRYFLVHKAIPNYNCVTRV